MNASTTLEPMNRFKEAQTNRTLRHRLLPQPSAKQEIRNVERLAEYHVDSKDSDLLLCRPCTPPLIESEEDPCEIVVADANEPTTEIECHSTTHTFVVCADSQLGMTSLNEEWETELDYCRKAVDKINSLQPRPKFVSVCGDLVDMENSFYYNNPSSLKKFELQDCENIQQKQFQDFQQTFDKLHPDIAIVCLCGNHDIGKLAWS